MLGPVPGVIGRAAGGRGGAAAARARRRRSPGACCSTIRGRMSLRAVRFRAEPRCRVCGERAVDHRAGGRRATRRPECRAVTATGAQPRARHDLPGVRRALRRSGAPTCASSCFGPLDIDYDCAGIARRADPGGDRGPARARCGATPSCCRWRAARRWGCDTGHDAAGARRSAGAALGRATSCGSRTRRSATPSLSFKDRVVAVALSKARELGIDDRRLRLDRQPGQRHRGAGGRRWACARWCWCPPTSSRPRCWRTSVYGAAGGRRCAGTLRRRQPACLRDRRPARLGLRERQPAPLLRRGLEDRRLRDRRAAGLAAARPRGGARWRAARCCTRSTQGFARARRAGPGAAGGAAPGRTARRPPAARPSPDGDRGPGRAGAGQAAAHHRQLAGDRQPGATPSTRARPSWPRAASRPAPDDEEIVAGMRLLAETDGHLRRDRRAAWWWRRPRQLVRRGAHRPRRRAGGAVLTGQGLKTPGGAGGRLPPSAASRRGWPTSRRCWALALRPGRPGSSRYIRRVAKGDSTWPPFGSPPRCAS